MNDNYGNERTTEGFFQEHVVGGDTTKQAEAGVSLHDDMFSAAEKVRDFSQTNSASNSTENNQSFSGRGSYGGPGIFGLIPIIAAILALGWIFNVLLPRIYHNGGRLFYLSTGLSELLVPIVLAWMFIKKRSMFNSKIVLRLLVAVAIWYVLRNLLLQLSYIADLLFASFLYIYLEKKSNENL